MKIKKLDKYVLKQFLTLLVATFFICLFIIVMQFIWLRIDDMIGKGIPMDVMAKFFFYACLTSTPMALPLAILLASLMTFGNLGERLELIAMKTSGISLFRVMKPLIVFISVIVIGAFFYSNYVIPVAQKRMWTLMFSFKQKSLELEVPVGEFYSGIHGKNIYARGKDTRKKALLDVMIYDFSKGFQNASITAADTVRITTTEDKQYIQIEMVNGESFENVRRLEDNTSNNVPYRRETFSKKSLLFEFDTSFKELDENSMANQHISKNIQVLTRDIDSVTNVRDSLQTAFSQALTEQFYRSQNPPAISQVTPVQAKSGKELFLTSSQKDMESITEKASSIISNRISDVRYNSMLIGEAGDFFIRHNVEWHLKFTLSFACLIFFFIGAPLGAIIGKGGLGLPTVISVVLFVIYYIINTMGQKMAREGIWEVWQGMWFSSAVLLPISLFITYRAVKDTMLLEADTYRKIFSKIKEKFSKRSFKKS